MRRSRRQERSTKGTKKHESFRRDSGRANHADDVEVRGGAGRCGEVRGGAGRCGEVRGGAGRAEERIAER